MSQLPVHAPVLLHLANPTEKYWGILEGLDLTGVTLRGIGLSSFDEWVRQIARRRPPALGLSTLFVPMQRVERVFLDEQIGEVESYCQRFERQVGMSVESYLGLPAAPEHEIPS